MKKPFGAVQVLAVIQRGHCAHVVKFSKQLSQLILPFAKSKGKPGQRAAAAAPAAAPNVYQPRAHATAPAAPQP